MCVTFTYFMSLINDHPVYIFEYFGSRFSILLVLFNSTMYKVVHGKADNVVGVDCLLTHMFSETKTFLGNWCKLM